MKTPIPTKVHTAVCAALTFIATGTHAQSINETDIDNASNSEKYEQIQVTGSFIRRGQQLDSPTPTATIGAKDIADIGASSIADVTESLTINTGAQNNPDGFTQTFTTGTTNINLRGLGLASTLVLIDGKRQVKTAVTAQDGVSFVDTSSMMPMIMLDRVEIVKDGASALYGSDAVAGVVNFITKKHVDGAEFSAEYQDGANGDYSEYTLQGLWGTTSEDSSTIFAVGYTDRQPLKLSEYRLDRPGLDTVSNLGNPGAFFIMPPIAPSPTPIIDPTGCEEQGGYPQLLAPAGVGPNGTDVGFCNFDFGSYGNLVPDESKLTGYAGNTYQLSDTITWENSLSFARNKARRDGSPSFPNLQLPVVPADHPENVFGIPVAFFGRAIGNGGAPDPYTVDSTTYRFSTQLQGELEAGYWQLSYTKAVNQFKIAGTDTLKAEFQDALNGFGGPACTASTGVAGQGNCMYFNPFATSYTTAPNDQSVIDGFIGNLTIDSESELDVVEALFSTELFEFGSDVAMIAAGVQYRKSTLSQDYNELANQDSFVFTIGNPDIKGDQDVYAAFAEVALPFTEQLDVQLALRYEDHGGAIGTTVDPKVALSYRINDEVGLRASYATSFRTPSVFQQEGGQTTLGAIIDPVSGTQAFVAIRSQGNADLDPEESSAYNIGLSFSPTHDFDVDVDYWHFDFEDIIIETNAQAIVNASVASPNPDAVIRAGDPTSGPIIQVNTGFVNASSVETSGVDLSLRYQIETEWGQFTPTFTGTYITKYDLEDPQAGKIDGAGRRNFTNFGTSTPELRYNAGIAWQLNEFSGNVFVRYTDSYLDDENCANEQAAVGGVCESGFKGIDSQLTVDAQLNVALGALLGWEDQLVVSLGAVNLTDEEPPQVFTNSGYDSKVHDPRGRQVYLRLNAAF